MSKKLNLNSDLGESFGAWDMGSDDAMLRIVNSANVACGYHAGDPLVMCKTTKLAKECGVSIGAHPGYPDLQGFGRRRMDIPLAELEAMLIYQIGALDACARSQGGRVTHVKPHGALSNIACADRKVADAVARAVAKLDPSLVLLDTISTSACARVDIGSAIRCSPSARAPICCTWRAGASASRSMISIISSTMIMTRAMSRASWPPCTASWWRCRSRPASRSARGNPCWCWRR